jgi:hypothetical protein
MRASFVVGNRLLQALCVITAQQRTIDAPLSPLSQQANRGLTSVVAAPIRPDLGPR